MDCDPPSLTAYKRAPPASPRRLVPTLQRSSSRGWSVVEGRLLLVLVSCLGSYSFKFSPFDSRALRGFSPALPASGRRALRRCSQQQSTTPAATSPVRGSSSTSPAPPSPPQEVESMATEQDSRCPICLDSWQEASYVMPCLHQFCYTCILRWTESKPECPLCRRRVTSILHSVRADNDFEEHVIPPPAAPTVVVQRAEGHPSAQNTHPPAAAQPSAAVLLLSHRVGGIYPLLWAFLFRVYPALLQPVLPWLQQELGLIFEDAQEAAAAAQQRVLSSLHLFGLDEGTLCQLLQDTLGRHTETFVHQLTNTIVERCSREAQQRMGMADAPAARGRQRSPAAVPGTAASRRGSPVPHPAPSSSPAGAHEEERPNTSTASLLGGPSSPPDAPVPTHGEQQELHEDPGEAVAGPSTPSQGRDRSPGGPRRATKRRASSSLDSSQPRKRPPRRPR